MAEVVDLWETPVAKEIHMLAGWRQWADAGSVSSGLPQYLIQQMAARQIGEIRSDGFYLFQIPATHDLLRPVVKFVDGYPESLETQHNDLYYAGNEQRGLVIFVGDEPQMDIERYVSGFLQAAQKLKVNTILGLGGVYGEIPYDKERPVSCIYSQQEMKDALEDLAVDLSDYQGGASIGSYLCKRAGEQGIKYMGMYTFVPAYDLSQIAEAGNNIRIETDFSAWLGVMRRAKYLLKLDIDLGDLEAKSRRLVEVMDAKVDELDRDAPELNVRDYMRQLSDQFSETQFEPLDKFWEDELKRLFDKFEQDEG